MNSKFIANGLKRIKTSGLVFVFRIIRNPHIFINYIKLFLLKINKNFLAPWQPIGATFFINDSCNMKCTFCGRSNGVFKKMSPAIIQDMSFAQFRKIFDSLKEIMHVSFSGIGEPLLNGDILPMMEYSKKNGKIIILNTNGILLSKSMAENLLRIGVDDVAVSIKASKKDFFTETTGLDKNYFDLIMENTENLIKRRNCKKSRMKIRINYVCSRDNIEDMKNAVRLANRLLVDELTFLPITMPNLLASKNLNKLFFSNDRKIAEEFSALLSEAKVKIKLPPLIKENSSGHCSFINSMISIDSTGNVSPCCGIPPKEIFGNVFVDENVLNNKNFVALRKLMANRPPHGCLKCAFFNDTQA